LIARVLRALHLLSCKLEVQVLSRPSRVSVVTSQLV
jgi:hypothetical protein